MNFLNKIGLGTVQWGKSYGIANQSGRPDVAQVNTMLEIARQKGVNLLDTAENYGEAEHILGQLRAKANGFRIVTKALLLRTDSLTEQHIADVQARFYRSLEQLNCDYVDGLLVHYTDGLVNPGSERLWNWLYELKEQQQVLKIGVSVYYPDQVKKILESSKVDFIQLPFNIYDQRFIQEGIFALLKKLGIEIHARSAFLQGLLLLPPDKLPRHFDSIRDHHSHLHTSIYRTDSSLLSSALSFSLQQPDIDYVIVGCESLAQLQELLSVAENTQADIENLQTFAINNREILDPTRWVL